MTPRLNIVFCFQALSVELVTFMVRLLETGLESVPKASSAKAHIVRALKSMLKSLKYGEEVCI